LLRGQRQDWVIVSKVAEEFADGLSRHDFSAAHTRDVRSAACNVWKPILSTGAGAPDGNDLAILEHEEVHATLAAL
jgi:hypothetical protein